MSKHVGHLLAAYVEGQLSPQRVAIIQRHIAICPICRAKLARHERLAADLRLTLGQSSIPRQAQVKQWWVAINTGLTRLTHRPLTLALLPIALSLLLLFVPLMAGQSGVTISPIPTPAQTSNTSPIADITLDPSPDAPWTGTTSQSAVADAVATPSLSADTTVPALPVPPTPLSP